MPTGTQPHQWSLRRQLLTGILLPVMLCMGLNLWWSYRSSLAALHTAYDRSLLASAKTIGEQLTVEGFDEAATIKAIVPYSALEAFEADTQSRLYYRVSTLTGQLISGFDEMPIWQGRIPDKPPYAALVDFYDAHFRAQPVRMAVLLQPVASADGRSMAVIQVAETLELRRHTAWQLLMQALWQHAILLGLLLLTILFVVQRVTRPMREVGRTIGQRHFRQLQAIPLDSVPRELQPIVEGMNQVMDRQRVLLTQQQRFIRDASHQLRTPLAVLKVQVQSARRGDLDAQDALQEIETTVDRAARLANQMLSLAKVEQLNQDSAPIAAWDAIVREVCLDLAPLIADKLLDLEVQADASAPVQGHEWMLRELVCNLLHNAIRHAPVGSHLSVHLQTDAQQREVRLHIMDQGEGLPATLLHRLYEPFSASDSRNGSGLGLAICKAIVQSLDGQLELSNRQQGSKVGGLDACVVLPLAPAQ